MNFSDGTGTQTLFEADGTVDLDDMQHLLDCYSGIAFNDISGGSVIPVIIHSYRQRRV